MLELAGLTEHCDFERQVHKSDSGVGLKPDVVVSLPGGGQIVIDAKSPIDPNEAAEKERDESEWPSYLDSCVSRVNDHLSKLAKKDYWQAFDTTPEFVVMYIPTESVYGAVVRRDRKLLERGAQANVIIATPTTLIAMLRTIHYTWRQQRLAENAKEIAKLGGELHKRLATFMGHFTKIGSSLGKTVDHSTALLTLMSRC